MGLSTAEFPQRLIPGTMTEALTKNGIAANLDGPRTQDVGNLGGDG